MKLTEEQVELLKAANNSAGLVSSNINSVLGSMISEGLLCIDPLYVSMTRAKYTISESGIKYLEDIPDRIEEIRLAVEKLANMVRWNGCEREDYAAIRVHLERAKR